MRNENIINSIDVEYVYPSHFEKVDGTKALKGVSLDIKKGQFVVVIGRNGSGKSTYARLLNALLLPSKGVIYINGIDTKEENNLWEIRKTCGMVFQNPDNQIIGTTVEEDTAFGPENLGVEPSEIRRRVDASLDAVGMSEYKLHAPHLLSGGQKQRVSIAGILAMKPECLILDEATAMLDPGGRKEVLEVVHRLNREEKLTVIHITHHMEEARLADRVVVIDAGRIVLDGKPKEVFSNVEGIKAMGLDVPQVTELFYELRKAGLKLPEDVVDIDEAVAVFRRLYYGGANVNKD
ncbi:MAG: energy-coupling factor transporter ATPase [Clostridia bacterium]|nr:energy-coupling factor transporter ATPase [Clostridia bacterium]